MVVSPMPHHVGTPRKGNKADHVFDALSEVYDTVYPAWVTNLGEPEDD
jgi:hypothetical protein